MSIDYPLSLLIVDDEVLETEYLLMLLEEVEIVDFKFQNISVAFNMKSAMEILERQPVDLVLCDIEMPQGSGLDLLRWMREKGLRTEVLIITCHPEFKYAQQAVRLSSADFLLKPIEHSQLEKGIARAMEHIRLNSAATNYLKNEQNLQELHFHNLMEGGLPIGGTFPSVEGLIYIYFLTDFSVREEGNGRIFARRTVLVNIVQDILFDFKVMPYFFFPEDESFFVAFRRTDLPEPFESFMNGRLSKLLIGSWRLLKLPMSCFVGECSSFEKLPGCYRSLNEKCEKICMSGGEIRTECVSPKQSRVLPGLCADEWHIILEHGGYGRVCREVEAYLNEIAERKIVPSDEIKEFSQKIIKAVLRYADRQHVDPDAVLGEAWQRELLLGGRHFIEDFAVLVRGVFNKLEQDYRNTLVSGQIAERVRLFIEAHAEDDLNRKMLAKHFSLSPEHLSRIFHSHVGVPLVTYITQTKLEYCCKIFKSTDCSVRKAAQQVGYTNFSYFSKLFRDFYGCSPGQYKQNIDKG